MIKLFYSPLVSIANIAYLASKDTQWHSLLPSPPPWHPNTAVSVGNQFMDGNGNVIQCIVGGTTGFNPPTWVAIGQTVTESTGVKWNTTGPAPTNELAAGGDASNTFFMDIISEPPRIFPGPAGSFWPSVLYVPNAVEIHFTAGYGAAVPIYDASGSIITGYTPPAGMPERCVTAIKMLVANWYENREAASALTLREIPNHIKSMLWSLRVYDAQPTRG